MKKQMTTLCLIICMTLFANGCGDDSKDESGGGQETGGPIAQSTPKETFNGFQDAVSKDEWNAAFQYLTDDSKNAFLGIGTMMATFSLLGTEGDEKAKELESIMEKHGVKDDGKEQTLAPEKMMQAMADMVADVKDKPALMKEIVAFMKKNSKDNKSPLDDLFKEKFQEAKIEGDTATVSVTVDGNDGDPTVLKKIDGKWYIDIIASEARKMKKGN